MQNTRLKLSLLLVVLTGLLLGMALIPVSAQGDGVPWATWGSLDLATVGDDNTGSSVAMSEIEGTPAIAVTPGGSSEETKLAIPLSGTALADFLTYSQIELEVYLPAGNAVNPNRFFLGMADLTGGEFAWVGGVFSETAVQPGWNRVVYVLDPAMRPVIADHTYTLFLSFFNADDAGVKTPLTEPFYLGGGYLSGENPIEAAAPAAAEGAAANALPETLVWTAWENKDITTIGDDNTGSRVAMADVDGVPAMMVTPGGSAEETKLAVPMLGADLADWANYTHLELQVYLPEGNALNPNRFFLGMADVTGGEFAWIAGVFSDTAAQTGWNTVVYPLDPAMRALVADHNYNLYFSFFNEQGGKIPLTEPFYLGSAALTGLDVTATPALTETVWPVWEAHNPGMFGDDNTGTEFAQSADVTNPAGTPTLQIIPSGTSEETKLAYPVSGNNLQAWLQYGQIQIEVYLPEENTLNPNTFFIGLAEITGEWTWAGGLFGTPTGDSGWIRVVATLDPVIREINPNGAYMLYIASFYQDGNGNKTPLTEPFYLGSIFLTPAPAAETTTVAPEDTTADDTYRQEVDILLRMDDDVFIESVARETFDFFWFEANPANGLIKDRSTPDSVASIASVGFGLAAIPIGVDRGWIDYDEGYERALVTLQTFTGGGVQGEHGFFYHFVNMETGERAWSSEVSSIDTALLVSGALVAGQYFAGTEVQALADQLYANVEWDWMLGGGDLLKMGWRPDGGFINAAWDHFDESLILYVLAIGSPTHPIPAGAWDLWDRPVNVNGGYIYLMNEPLFVYQYPLAFLDLRGKEDFYANYWNNTALACQRNRQFAIDNSEQYLTYQNGVWGISASDGPFGYRAYGASGINHDGTVAPYAAAACLPFTPDIALEGMRAILTEYGVQAWREYGFVSAINADENWFSREHIGIDQGDILLMLTNSQDGFVWNQFMANPNIQNALAAMGFVDSSGDYAVTPAYMAQVTGQ